MISKRGFAARLLAVGLTGVLTASGGVPAVAAEAATPGAAGLGDRLFPLLGNGGYDVQNYDLHLTYPRTDPAQAVTGEVTVTAVATQSLSRFDLDFGGDSSQATVTLDGRRVTFHRDGDELVVTPSHPILNGKTFVVTVSGFTATPTTPDPDDPPGFLITPEGTVMAGQPDAAHMLFPDNDHPRDKATYTIALTVPEDWTGVASGVLTGTTSTDGYVTSTYRESQPMASELLQVVAGDYVVYERPSVDGVPIRDVLAREVADWAPYALADEGATMSWMRDNAGQYPLETYGSLVVGTDIGLALETQTLALYDKAVVSAPPADRDPTLVHELAHQWYGDSVSPYEWSDLWLNEGHASWYELMFSDHLGDLMEYVGVATVDDYFKGVYSRGDLRRSRYGPVAQPKDANSFGDLFNPNVYSGGALVLYALRQQVGTDAFRQIEQAWAARYRGRSASTRDFINLASEVAGRDLHAFLTAWLYSTTTPPMPGHPDWTVTPGA